MATMRSEELSRLLCRDAASDAYTVPAITTLRSFGMPKSGVHGVGGVGETAATNQSVPRLGECLTPVPSAVWVGL